MPEHTLTFEFAAIDSSVRGYLAVLIDDITVWPQYRAVGGVPVDMSVLLPFLTHWYQNFSRDVGNRWNEQLISRLSSIYTASQESGMPRELLIEFKNAYNMSASINIYVDSELWISPQSNRFILECNKIYQFPFEQGLDAVITLGNLVRDKLSRLGGYDEIISAWDKR